ncbi:MAG: 2-nitropropane dioxygenase, partial [Brevundimonas sp.]|nr:2-nitropropane dioxygenase [Brevundimonas sp.]
DSGPNQDLDMTASHRGPLAGLILPVMAAPMLLASSLALVRALRAAGVFAGWQASNARTPEDFAHWLDILAADDREAASQGRVLPPHAVNLRVDPKNPIIAAKMDLCKAARVPWLLTSLGDPTDVVERAHAWGGHVIHDATTIRFAEKAIDAGVDGLLLVCAGAGGHTGHLSPFAFIPAVRKRFDGLILAAGGIADGAGIAGALAMGADLACMGTRFIATEESGVVAGHRALIVEAKARDLVQSDSLSGVPAHWLAASLTASGLDPSALPPRRGVMRGAILPEGVKAWRDLWSAGHSVELIDAAPPAAAVVQKLREELGRTDLSFDWLARAETRLGQPRDDFASA